MSKDIKEDVPPSPPPPLPPSTASSSTTVTPTTAPTSPIPSSPTISPTSSYHSANSTYISPSASAQLHHQHPPLTHHASSSSSSTTSSLSEPPLPPPGFHPPVAFNPAANSIRRAGSSGSASGSSGRGSAGEAELGWLRGEEGRNLVSPSGRRVSGEGDTSRSPPVHLAHTFTGPGGGSNMSSPSFGPIHEPPLPSATFNPPPAFSHHSSASSSTSSFMLPASSSSLSSPRGPLSPSTEANNPYHTSPTDLRTGPSPSPPPLLPHSISSSSANSSNSSNALPTVYHHPPAHRMPSSSNSATTSSSPTPHLELLSPSIFTLPAGGFIHPPPPMNQRSNSEAWDSVWPATSPHSVPHLPTPSAAAMKRNSDMFPTSSSSSSPNSHPEVLSPTSSVLSPPLRSSAAASSSHRRNSSLNSPGLGSSDLHSHHLRHQLEGGLGSPGSGSGGSGKQSSPFSSPRGEGATLSSSSGSGGSHGKGGKGKGRKSLDTAVQGSPEIGKVAVTPSLVLGAMSNGGGAGGKVVGGDSSTSSAVDLSDEFDTWKPHPSFPSRRSRSSVSSASSSASGSSSTAVVTPRPPPPSRPARRSPSPHVSSSSSSSRASSSKVASSSSHRSSSSSSTGSSNAATSGRQQSPPPAVTPRDPTLPPLVVPTLGRSRSNSAASRFNPDTTIPSIFIPPFSTGEEGTPPSSSPPQPRAPVLKSPRPMPASLPSFLADFEESLDPSTAIGGSAAADSPLFGSLGGAAEKLEDEEESSVGGGGGVSINVTTPNDTISTIHSPSPPLPSLSNGRDRSPSDPQFLVHPLSSSSSTDASPSAPVTSSNDSSSPLDLEDPRDALRRKREAKSLSSSRTPSPIYPLPPSPGTFFGQEELEREQEEIASLETPRPRLFGHGLTESDEEDAGEQAEGMWKATVVQPVDSDSSRDGDADEGGGSSSEDEQAAQAHQHHPENHSIDPNEGVEICNSPEDTDEYDLPSPLSPPSSAGGQQRLPSPRNRPPHPSFSSPSGSSDSSSSNSSTSAPTLLADAPSFFPPQNGPSPPPPGADEEMMGVEGGFEGQGQDGFLPAVADMDLEDENLTTLERIFLLSKSEFTHHRTFISKVIGDWVEDVDPCETVEYVLPLLNSLGTDEDEAVREALAPGLHKILWFFYSSCRLLTEEDDPLEAEEELGTAVPEPTTVTVTSEGITVVRRPTLDDLQNLPVVGAASSSGLSETTGPSSGDSLTASNTSRTPSDTDTTTPGSTLYSSAGTEDTTVSPTGADHPFGLDYEPTEKEEMEASMKRPVRMPRPVISVQTFTPLIGSLLMSQSSVVCDSAKVAIIGILARLRGKDLPNYDPFPERHVEVGQARTYFSQTGVHIHEISALSEAEKKVVENELVQAIVIGMARLDETQSPYEDEEGMGMGGGEEWGGEVEEGGGGGDTGMFENYQWPEREQSHQGEGGYAYENQQEEEQQGVEQQQEQQQQQQDPIVPSTTITAAASSSSPPPPSPETEPRPPSPGSIVLTLPSPGEEEPLLSEPSPLSTPTPVHLTTPEESMTSPAISVPAEDDDHHHHHHHSSDRSSPETSTYTENLMLEQSLQATSEYDSPNAPPIDHRTDDEESAWAAQESQYTFGENQFRDELAVEASHGRLLSMNLIAAVLECGVLEGEEVIERQFVPEVVRMRFDDNFAVRREACGALAELVKVVSVEIVMESLLPLFDAFASDESPHVRQSACLALPALAKRLSPPSFRRSHALKAMNAFFNDEFTEIHSTALEVLGELIAVFVDDPEGAPPDLVRHFLGPPKEERQEEVEQPTLNLFASGPPIFTMEDNRPLVCAFNFPAVALTCGRSGWPLLRDYYHELCSSKHIPVRRSLAASIHELAVILGDDIASVDLVPFFRACLEDVDEVRERLWENLHTFVRALEQKTAWPLIHEIGELLVQGKLSNWRLREKLMTALPDLADGMIEASRGRYLVVSLLQVGLVDAVAAVREAAIQSVVPVYAATRRVDDAEAREALDAVLVVMSHHPRYRQRQTFVRTIESFLDHKYNPVLTMRVIPYLLPCNEDPVVEVRLALAKVVSRFLAPDGLCPVYAEAPTDLQTMATSLYNDSSFDVKALIAPIYPSAVIPRRPSSVPSQGNSPRPLTRRTSSTSTTLSVASSSASSSSRAGSLSPSTAEELAPLTEATDFESALQLENLPSPRMSPRVIPGYELGGYAFPAELERAAAASAVADISSGRPDPFKYYAGGGGGGDTSPSTSTSTTGLDLDVPYDPSSSTVTTPTRESIVATPRPRANPNNTTESSEPTDSYFPQTVSSPPRSSSSSSSSSWEQEQQQQEVEPTVELGTSPPKPWTQEGPGDYVSVNVNAKAVNGSGKDASSEAQSTVA